MDLRATLTKEQGHEPAPEVIMFSSSTAEASVSSDYGDQDSSPSSTPPSTTTHDISRAQYHMKDLRCFATSLENSARRAFPNKNRSKSRYTRVEVLLLRWEDDDLGVIQELNDLAKVFETYGFHTETWLIPSNKAHRKLNMKVIDFVEEYENDKDDTLLIIYYGGHAKINAARQSTWDCQRDVSSASLEWSSIQTILEKASSDVLILLDCCAAASAAPMAGCAMTETIAACGWDGIAPEPGQWSFTNALIEVLEDWVEKSFSVAMLHSEVLSTLKHGKPEKVRVGRQQRVKKVERRRTPVYIVTTTDHTLPSIDLSRIHTPNNFDQSQTPSLINPLGPKHHSVSDVEEGNIPFGYGENEVMSATPMGDLQLPHVLISIALEGNQSLDADACCKWLASFPALAKYVCVKGVYKSYSTLLIASIPVTIWDLLPDDLACSFIGFVTSENLIQKFRPEQEPEALLQPMIGKLSPDETYSFSKPIIHNYHVDPIVPDVIKPSLHFSKPASYESPTYFNHGQDEWFGPDSSLEAIFMDEDSSSRHNGMLPVDSNIAHSPSESRSSLQDDTEPLSLQMEEEQLSESSEESELVPLSWMDSGYDSVIENTFIKTDNWVMPGCDISASNISSSLPSAPLSNPNSIRKDKSESDTIGYRDTISPSLVSVNRISKNLIPTTRSQVKRVEQNDANLANSPKAPMTTRGSVVVRKMDSDPQRYQPGICSFPDYYSPQDASAIAAGSRSSGSVATQDLDVDVKESRERGGLDPLSRKLIENEEIPSLREQEEQTRLEVTKIMIDKWRCYESEEDDEPLDSKRTNLSVSGINMRKEPYSSNALPRSGPHMLSPGTSTLDHTEGLGIMPLEDTKSIRENKLVENQPYFYPPDSTDMELMTRSRHWNDPPMLPYKTGTQDQPPTAKDSMKHWNEMADQYSLISRTASWGSMRQREVPDPADFPELTGGNFLKIWKKAKELKARRPGMWAKFPSLVWKTGDGGKLKRKQRDRDRNLMGQDAPR